MVRLEEPGPPSTLRVGLVYTEKRLVPLTQTLVVADEEWRHAWYELAGLIGEPLTLTFSVSDSRAVILDEVSLGSSPRGGYPLYLPLVHRVP
jgi:hypothetical protein